MTNADFYSRFMFWFFPLFVLPIKTHVLKELLAGVGERGGG